MATIQINCRDVWREVSDYIDQQLDADLRRRLDEHFKDCKHCSAILDGTRNVLRLVGDGEAFELPIGFDRRLRDRFRDLK